MTVKGQDERERATVEIVQLKDIRAGDVFWNGRAWESVLSDPEPYRPRWATEDLLRVETEGSAAATASFRSDEPMLRRVSLAGSEAREREHVEELTVWVERASEAERIMALGVERVAVLVEALKERQEAIDAAVQVMDGSQYVGGPSQREAWHTAFAALQGFATQNNGMDAEG